MRKPATNFKWDVAATAAENARKVLPAMASDLFAEGRKAINGRMRLARLHRFRLLVKRFRYTMELFEPLYGPAGTERLARLHQVQQYLGRINDCAATRRLLERKRKGAGIRRGLKRVHQHLDEAEADRVRRFLEFWKEDFDRPGEQARWVRDLRLFAEQNTSEAAR